METSNGLAAQNGHSVQRGMTGPARAAGVSIRMPHAVRNGVVLYGQVRSTDGASWYTVKKVRLGTYRFSYACTCLGNFLGGYSLCRHIAALKLAEGGR